MSKISYADEKKASLVRLVTYKLLVPAGLALALRPSESDALEPPHTRLVERRALALDSILLFLTLLRRWSTLQKTVETELELHRKTMA